MRRLCFGLACLAVYVAQAAQTPTSSPGAAPADAEIRRILVGSDGTSNFKVCARAGEATSNAVAAATRAFGIMAAFPSPRERS